MHLGAKATSKPQKNKQIKIKNRKLEMQLEAGKKTGNNLALPNSQNYILFTIFHKILQTI